MKKRVLCGLCAIFVSGQALGQSLAYELTDSVRGPAPSSAAIESRYLRVNASALSGETIHLRVPLFDREVVANRTFVEQRDNGTLSWQGHLDGDSEQQISLTFDGEHLAGYISTVHGVYEISPTANGNVLMHIDTERFPPCGGAVPVLSSPDSTQTKLAGVTEGAANEMDVLVVFSPGSLAQLGNQAAAQVFAQQAVDSANLAYTNSQMTSRMRLVGVRFTARADSGSSSTDLSWVRSDPEVTSWRNEVGADMVGMISEFSNACGQGYLMSTPGSAFAPNAFQVTARNCAIGNLTYAHEHGHNMGMMHNPEAGGSGAYPYAYGHFVSGSYRTVMSYSTSCVGGCTRHPYFSNPNVVFMGQPTGIANQRDNARVGNQTAPIVAQFRSGRPDAIFSATFE